MEIACLQGEFLCLCHGDRVRKEGKPASVLMKISADESGNTDIEHLVLILLVTASSVLGEIVLVPFPKRWEKYRRKHWA